MLCRNHDGNKASFILAKVMCHLEEELSALSCPKQSAELDHLSDPDGRPTSRNRKRKMAAKEELRERRWDRGCVWVPGLL